MNLEELFLSLLAKIGFSDAEAAAKWKELHKAYSAKSRYYHNLKHLQEMIACFENYRDLLQHPDEVLYAIFYHDYIYKITKKNNELRSAQYAVSILPTDSSLDKYRVFNLILSTKDHQCSNNDDEKWLIDFDLRILAKEWDDYLLYAQQIRREYRIYPDFMYKPGRKKALVHFLTNPFIFQTGTFQSLYETKARENIQHEIAYLSN
ncbi:HD domain-containing protein [Flavobacterium sp. GCM10027622]|uniref:HD domain-containing protein n=1 Tax=unclassified Flavobacterium TaxID=196869 RepID=UPI003606B30D